ncbi:MAG: aldo/keto reductase [Alphaproteobacteria bacterium]|nr:aldo/keto reductase [Alphaproteobacteria bacterium]
MEYVNLGHTGLKVSRICLGMMTYGDPAWRPWTLGEKTARPFVKAALDAGINFFDTADMYSLGASEEVTGRAIRDMAKRDEVVIATKLYNEMSADANDRGLSRKHVMASIDRSLKRLGTDHVDLYQIHRWDDETPIEETIQALDDVVRAGKARYLGASSCHAWKFARALLLADAMGCHRFVCMQPHYNLVYREEEREMLPLCEAEGIGVIPWSPLARGFLAGTRSAAGEGTSKRAKSDDWARKLYYSKNDLAVLDRVKKLAIRRGVKPAQIALAWHLHKPFVTAPIVGASKMEHLTDAIAALEIKLTPKEIASLEERYQPHPVLGM